MRKRYFFKIIFICIYMSKKSCINFLHCFVLFLKLFILMEAVYIRYILYTVYLGIFRGDLIFSFFGITFKSQHIQYAEIISSNVWQKKLLNRKKWLTQIKIGTHFLLFCKFCDMRKKDIRYALKLIIVMIHVDKNTPKLFNINPLQKEPLSLF